MALIKCGECGKEFSDKASACPNCACPVNTSVNSTLIETIEYNNGTACGTLEIYNNKVKLTRKMVSKTIAIVAGISTEEKIKEFYFKDMVGIDYQKASALNHGHMIFKVDSITYRAQEGNGVYWKKQDNDKFERIYNLVMEQYHNNK